MFNLRSTTWMMALALMLFTGGTTEAKVPDYTPGTYNIDAAHTRVSFIVPHLVVGKVQGRFNEVSGEFVLAEKFTDSTVTASIPVKSIDTGIKQRDDHLRSADFFEVEKYPTMSLKSKSVRGRKNKFRLTAALTIKDVTKDVVFEGQYTGSAVDAWDNQRAAIQLTGKVNRKDFNINYDDQVEIGPAVGDEVEIRIFVQGILEKDKKEEN